MDNTINDIVLSNLFTFESLVQFPLTSIIEASASGNKTTLDFISQYCFHIVDGKNVARTLVFYYDYIKEGAAQTMKVEIPIISLITMPFYTIESARFEMGVNIISWLDNTDNTSINGNVIERKQKLLALLGPYASTTKASTQSTESLQYSKINTNMKVKMEVISSDLPAGILQLINVSSQGVDGNIAYDFRISSSSSKLVMDKSNVLLTLKLVRNGDDKTPVTESEVSLVPLTVTVKSNVSGIDPTNEFCKEISVKKGDIVGVVSFERIKVLTESDGEIRIEFHPSSKISTNGFVTVSSPITSDTKIYYRSKNA